MLCFHFFTARVPKATIFTSGAPRFWVLRNLCTKVECSTLIFLFLWIILSNLQRYVKIKVGRSDRIPEQKQPAREQALHCEWRAKARFLLRAVGSRMTSRDCPQKEGLHAGQNRKNAETMIEISHTAISRPLQCYMHLNILFQQYLIQSMPKLVISKVNSVFLLPRPDRVNRSYPPVYRILIFGGVATLPAEASFPLSLAGAGRRKRESLFVIACPILFRINVRF